MSDEKTYQQLKDKGFILNGGNIALSTYGAETLGRDLWRLFETDNDFAALWPKLDMFNLAEDILHNALLGASVRLAPMDMIVGIARVSNIDPEDIVAAIENERSHGYDRSRNS